MSSHETRASGFGRVGMAALGWKAATWITLRCQLKCIGSDEYTPRFKWRIDTPLSVCKSKRGVVEWVPLSPGKSDACRSGVAVNGQTGHLDILWCQVKTTDTGKCTPCYLFVTPKEALWECASNTMFDSSKPDSDSGWLSHGCNESPCSHIVQAMVSLKRTDLGEYTPRFEWKTETLLSICKSERGVG